MASAALSNSPSISSPTAIPRPSRPGKIRRRSSPQNKPFRLSRNIVVPAARAIGGSYALVALGYTMVYGVLRLINFAHGDITMTGAFSAYFLARSFARSGFLDAHPLLATLGIMCLSMAVCTGTALIVERVCYRPFRYVETLATLICAIGASFVLLYTFRRMFG